MSPHPTPTPNDPGQQAADTEFYRQTLHDFITIGTDLARLLHQQAAAQPAAPGTTPPAPPTDAITATIAFDRLARAVRRSITLARTLIQPPPPAQTPAQHRAATRKRILREVEDTIQRPYNTPDHDSEDTAQALQAELHDRLDAPDLDDDITTRPVADIIQEICRDLGLDANPGTRPWKRRTPDDLRHLNARAAAPSRPQPPGPAPQRTPPPIGHPAARSPARAASAPVTALPLQDRWPPPPGA